MTHLQGKAVLLEDLYTSLVQLVAKKNGNLGQNKNSHYEPKFAISFLKFNFVACYEDFQEYFPAENCSQPALICF
jgi:hypothetical protein